MKDASLRLNHRATTCLSSYTSFKYLNSFGLFFLKLVNCYSYSHCIFALQVTSHTSSRGKSRAQSTLQNKVLGRYMERLEWRNAPLISNHDGAVQHLHRDHSSPTVDKSSWTRGPMKQQISTLIMSPSHPLICALPCRSLHLVKL